MALRRRNNTVDALAAMTLVLRAIRDSADAFPPLKSAAAAVMTVVEMSQRPKSNRKDCKRLAIRAAELVHDIYRQTKDYGDRLPAEVQSNIEQIERIFCDIVDFMRDIQGQTRWRSFARQDPNKSRIDEFQKLLDDTILGFSVNLQLSVQMNAFRMYAESSRISEKRHDEVLIVSQMSEGEQLQLLTKIQRDVNVWSLFFFDIMGSVMISPLAS